MKNLAITIHDAHHQPLMTCGVTKWECRKSKVLFLREGANEYPLAYFRNDECADKFNRVLEALRNAAPTPVDTETVNSIVRWQHEETGMICELPPGKNPGRRWYKTKPANEKLSSGGTPSAQVPCPACGGTGQDDPPPGKYHGLCPKCGGSGKQNGKDQAR